MRQEGALGVLGRRQRLVGIREGDEEAVTLRVHLDSAVPHEARPEQTAMVAQRLRIALAERAQESCRPFDVGEEEGDAARR